MRKFDVATIIEKGSLTEEEWNDLTLDQVYEIYWHPDISRDLQERAMKQMSKCQMLVGASL